MSLTKEQVAAHVECPGCPFCGDWSNISIIAIILDDIEGTEITLRQICRACKQTWREYFKIYDVEKEDADGVAIDNEEG